MNITDLEIKVLAAFSGADDCLAGDAGASWTDATDLARTSGLDVASVKGVLGSLVKKGLVYASDEPGLPPAVCLEVAGAEIAVRIENGLLMDADAAPAFEEAPFVPVAAEADFAQMFAAAGGKDPRGTCKALRLVAANWVGTRAEFVAGAFAAGLHMDTAKTQWQKGRKGA